MATAPESPSALDAALARLLRLREDLAGGTLGRIVGEALGDYQLPLTQDPRGALTATLTVDTTGQPALQAVRPGDIVQVPHGGPSVPLPQGATSGGLTLQVLSATFTVTPADALGHPDRTMLRLELRVTGAGYA